MTYALLILALLNAFSVGWLVREDTLVSRFEESPLQVFNWFQRKADQRQQGKPKPNPAEDY
jgi:hypothetical protein